MLKRAKVLIAGLIAVAAAALAQAQGVVTLTATPPNGTGAVVPTLTWTTVPVAVGCTASGGWSGTKQPQGTQTLTSITTTTDYRILCSWATGTGSARVSWVAPAFNTNGTPADNLTGFRVLYGTSAANLNRSKDVPGVVATATDVTGLAAGPWSFAVRALNAANAESDNSAVVQKTVVGAPAATAEATVRVEVTPRPNPPTGVTVVETTAYNIDADFGTFAFVRGARWGTAAKGAACDATRCVTDGRCVVKSRRSLTPRPPLGEYKVARCG